MSIRTSIALYTAICIILVGGGIMVYADYQLERSLSQSYQAKFENATSLIAGSLSDELYELDVRQLRRKLHDAKVVNPAVLRAVVADPGGRILAEGDLESDHRDVLVKEILGRDVPSSHKIESYFEGDQLDTSIAIHDPQGDLLGYLLIDFSLKDDLAYLHDVQASGVRLMAVLVAVGTVLGYVAASRFTQPILQIADVANEIRRRNFDARVTLDRADELGLLAATMNTMVEELQRNDDYVNSIFRSIKHSLLVVGPDGTVEAANPASCEITGWGMDSLLGVQISKIIDFSKVNDVEVEVTFPGLPGSSSDAILKTATGSEIPVYVTSAAIPGSRDQPKRVVYVATDISERVRLEWSLREAIEAAEETSKAKSRFLANISHEIRTPLNGIIGFTDLLRDCKSEETRREYLGFIRSSGQHLLTLINDILDLSKIEADQLTLESTRFSPHEIFRDVTEVLRVKADERDLKLEYRWDGPVPRTILSDSARLRQLVMNLVANAIKFTEEGSVEVTIRCDQRNRRLITQVRDTGIGIAADKLDSIFDPFVQADSSFTRRFGGTGLGLAISRRIAADLGGELTVRSDLGKGSLFSFAVDTGPLGDVEMLEQPLDGPLDSEATEDVSVALPRAKVLLVEDMTMNRNLLRIILEEAGLEVVTAENGQVGCELAEQGGFDAILMDMQMPVMDGYTAARKLREKGFTIPIVALTAHAMRGDEKKCRDAGCSHYLTKPIQQVQLVKCLESVLGATDPPREPAEIAETEERQAAGEDEQVLLSTLPMKGAVYQTVIDEFGAFLDGHVAEMREAFAVRDFPKLSELAHSLKGAGGTAGFDVLTVASRKLEHHAQDQDEESTETSLRELSKMARKVLRGLDQSRLAEMSTQV